METKKNKKFTVSAEGTFHANVLLHADGLRVKGTVGSVKHYNPDSEYEKSFWITLRMEGFLFTIKAKVLRDGCRAYVRPGFAVTVDLERRIIKSNKFGYEWILTSIEYNETESKN